MQNFIRCISKKFKTFFCLVLSLLLIFASVPAVFAEDMTVYEEGELMASIQEFIVKAVSLSSADRELLAVELEKVSTAGDINPGIIDAIHGIMGTETIEQETIQKALTRYANDFTSSLKTLTIDYIRNVDYPETIDQYDGFTEIKKAMNEAVIGDEENDDGFKFVVASLVYLTSKPGIEYLAFNDPEDVNKIQFRLDGFSQLKSDISELLNETGILADEISEYENDSSFEKVLLYLEDIVNTETTEIDQFKYFLGEDVEVFAENKIEVKVSSETAQAGTKTSVTISLDSVDEIGGIQFFVRYDSNVFEVLQGDITVNLDDNSIDNGFEELTDNQYLFLDYNDDDLFNELVDNTVGEVGFYFATVYSLEEEVDLLTINFSVKETADPGSYQISIEDLVAYNDATNPEQVFVRPYLATIIIPADKTVLAEKISFAQELSETNFTADSWTALQTALTAAIAVNDDASATQGEVDNAATALQTAIDNLEYTPEAGLAAKIEEAQALTEADYTSESWEDLETALEDAITVSENPEATEEEINNALEALQTAIDNLEYAVRAKLIKKIEEAERLTQANYTTASWAALETALTDAKNASDNSDATKEELNEALNNLQAAINGLKRPKTPGTGTSYSRRTTTGSGVYRYPAPDFDDVPSSHWAKPYIEYMAEERIIEGRDDGKFYPEDPVTRAEFAKLITVALGIDNSYATANFTDVSSNQWHYRYVASAVNNGIILGYPDGSFDPNAQISRQDMAVIIARAMGYRDGSPASGLYFADADQVAEYAVGHVGYCTEKGYITGRPGNIMDPKGITTRAEAAVVIYRLLQY
jgi:hypothetical protein